MKKGVSFKTKKTVSAARKKKGQNTNSAPKPPTQTVNTLTSMSNETTTYRKEAQVVQVWKPFVNPVRAINTSTK